jgi:hypothetical protein
MKALIIDMLLFVFAAALFLIAGAYAWMAVGRIH